MLLLQPFSFFPSYFSRKKKKYEIKKKNLHLQKLFFIIIGKSEEMHLKTIIFGKIRICV